MYFDLQINGYGGIDFNSPTLTADDLRVACQKLRDDQVQHILATIITAGPDQMQQQIRTICQARTQYPLVKEVIAGLHLEGPFISREEGYVGAHPVEHVQDADVDLLQRLIDAGEGLVRIVTLAPECDLQQQLTKTLVRQSIVVSAGHCNPMLEQLQSVIDAGLSMFTHLGNACPRRMDRHDNIIQRVLSVSNQLWIGFIADGVHIPLFALKNYLNTVGYQRAFVVTDAISAAGQGAGQFQLGQQTVIVDNHLATWSADRSHLVGSACTMPQNENNLRQLGLSEEEMQQLLFTNPQRALGINVD